jgi:hypothetical protein
MGYFDKLMKSEKTVANITRHVVNNRQEQWEIRNEMKKQPDNGTQRHTGRIHKSNIQEM